MIRQFITLPYDWGAVIYYDSTVRDIPDILQTMDAIGCSTELLQRAEANLKGGALNRGVTYSDPWLRMSVVVIGKASSSRQFFNSYDHEKNHLAEHIATYNGIDEKSEEMAYLRGYIAQKTYGVASKLLCECGERS